MIGPADFLGLAWCSFLLGSGLQFAVSMWWRSGLLGDVVAAALVVFLIGYFCPGTGILDKAVLLSLNAVPSR